MTSLPDSLESHDFQAEIRTRTGVSLNKCYQCGKCSAGCALSGEMDYPPSLILRMLQTGEADLRRQVLSSVSIWLCVSCEMCLSRCPMEIDIPALMDYLRSQSSLEKTINPAARKIVAFHRSFLDSIRYTGRLFELGTVAEYKFRSGALTQDMAKAPQMLVRGKLGLKPEFIRGRKSIAGIFRQTINKKELSR